MNTAADDIKYLGLSIDRHMSWAKQTILLVKISNRQRSVCRRDWGLSSKLLKRIYPSSTERIVLDEARTWWPRDGEGGALVETRSDVEAYPFCTKERYTGLCRRPFFKF